jgi:hypothetical protein
LAHAAGPTATTTAELIGLTKALKTYCGRVDHGNVGPLEGQVERLLKGIPGKSIDQTQHSAAYNETYDTYVGVFNGLPANLGVELCRAFTGQEKPADKAR